MNDLRLQVLLQALDKASAPLKRIDGASKGAGKALRETRDSLKRLDELQGQVGDFRRLKQGTRDNETELGKLQARIGELSSSIRANDGDVAKHTAELKRATRAAAALKAKHQQQTEQLQALRGRLAEAGINTRQLSEAERRLRADTAATTAKLDQQKEALKQHAIQTSRLAAIEKSTAPARATRAAVGSQLLGTTAAVAGVGYALSRVIGTGNEFDYQLQLIGNTADMTSHQVNNLRERIMVASRDTGQSASTVERALGFLVAAGMDTKTATESILAIGRTATAAGADIEDISRAAFTLNDALAIRPDGLQKAMDMLAQAGKEGNVELRDMAKVLPQFGAAFQSMKMQGPQAVATLGAALEIARKGAPDADQAANNMANFFQKILSPDTLNKAKANFGIDLYKVITHAQSKGANPFEASMRAIMKMTGGDMKKLGELFQDAQVQHFVLPMMQNWKEYERIRDKALSATGVTDRDFDKVMGTAKQQLDNAANAGGRLAVVFSRTLAPVLGRVAQAVTPVLDRMAAFTNAHPRLVAGVLSVVASLAGLRLAFLALRFAWTFLGGGMLVRAAGQLRAFGTGARAVMLLLGGVSAPVLAIGAVLAVVAYTVWKYWAPIKAFFIGFAHGLSDVLGPAFAALGQALAPLKPAWDLIARGMRAVWGWAMRLLGPFHVTSEQLAGATSAGVTFGRVIGYVLGGVVTAITWVVKAFVGIGTAIGEGAGALTEALRAPFRAAFDWVERKIGWIIDKWRALKAKLHIGSDEPQPAGAPRGWAFDDGAKPPPRIAIDTRPPLRASGGSVTHNQYQVSVTAMPGHEKAAADTVSAELDRRERAKAARRRSRLSDDE